MTNLELISLLANAASLVLAVVAIWLSFVFYRLGSEAAERAHSAAKTIADSVQRVKEFSDKFYTDTFAMMRDTFSEMRAHVWGQLDGPDTELESQIERRSTEKIELLRQKMNSELARIFEGEKSTSQMSEIKQLIDETLWGSRVLQTEARSETIRDQILKTVQHLTRYTKEVTADQIVRELRNIFTPRQILEELERLRQEGRIRGKGSIIPTTVIYIESSNSGLH